MNTIRAHLSEFGIVTPKACRWHDAKAIHSEADQKTEWNAGFPTNDRLLEAAKDLPEAARPAVDMLADQLRETQDKIDDLTARIVAAQKADPLARRLATIPGLGAITASAIAATTPEVDNFSSARDYAAWLGLTPQPHSSGGKERLGRISKGEAPNAIRPREGPNNRYLRRLLYLGASRRRRASGTT